MITGTVNARREAILRLVVRDASGQEHECDAIVDTGYDGWFTLPPPLIAVLNLQWYRFGRAILADGSESVFNIYRGEIIWDGQPRNILIYEMDADPLVGMSLMYGYELRLPILDGATFELHRIVTP